LVSQEDAALRDVVDAEVSLEIWKAVQGLVPDTFQGCSLTGPHPRLRLLQYHGDTASEGDHPVHADTPLAAPDSYSRLTVLVYVNSGFTGGNLRFVDDGVDVEPRAGTVVIFDHGLLHQAAAVLSGSKQVVKLSVLYEAEAETKLPHQTTTGADMEVRWPFVLAARAVARGFCAASPEVCDFITRPALVERMLGFVGTKRQELSRLVADAGRGPQDARRLEELLDFVLAYDTEDLGDILGGSGFMAMTMALATPGLRLKAYRAWEAARFLHGDEKCVLLGETLLKDTSDPDPEVRLACVGSYFFLIPSQHEELRCQAINKVLVQEEDPAVRHRAVQGIANLVHAAKQVAEGEERSARLATLRESYAETLSKIAAAEASSSFETSLALRALAELAMSQDTPP